MSCCRRSRQRYSSISYHLMCSSSLSHTLVYKPRATSSVSFSTKCFYNEPRPGSQQGARPKPLSPQTYLTGRKIGQKNYIGCLSPVELDLTNISISASLNWELPLMGKPCAVDEEYWPSSRARQPSHNHSLGKRGRCVHWQE
jgi:hypothetical protein